MQSSGEESASMSGVLYKVVQTIERGRAVFTTVPAFWEENGLLVWPKNVKEVKLKLDENHPRDDWGKYKCIVKRWNIHSYEEAEREARKLCAAEMGDELLPPPPKQRRVACEVQTYAPHQDFVGDPLECTMIDPISKTTPQAGGMIQSTNKVTGNLRSPAYNSAKLNDTFIQGPLQISNDSRLSTNILTLMEQQSNVLALLRTVIENQKHLSSNQDNISSKQAELSAQFVDFTKRYFASHNSKKIKNETDFKIITDIDDFENFENMLKNSKYADALKKMFSIMIGKHSGKGVTSAYKLIDLIFDREFMSKCSWSGGSRSSEEKICFKAFQRTLDFFFQVVRESDELFTMDECESFIKVILRNSKKRCENMNLRQSTKRNRRKIR